MQNGTIYEFAEFSLIKEDDLLLRHGVSLHLSPKAFATLVLLIERRGHLVRKSEIIEKVWLDSFVEESAVSRCVWKIRNALGEDSKSQRFIQTVPKSGYKFVADVAERRDQTRAEPLIKVDEIRPDLPISSPTEGTASALSPTQSGHRSLILRRWNSFAVTAGVIVLAIAGILYLTSARPKVLSASSGDRIAILPLMPIDLAARSDIYEIGIADSLIQRLSAVDGFVVRPLSATRKYTAIDQDPLAAGREQQVDYVLASNYQIADGMIKVTSQLFNIASGNIEDTYQTQIKITNVFAAQDAVAGAIHNELAGRFARTDYRSPAKRGTANEEAYKYYLQGMVFLDERRGRKALEHLDKAVTLDPDYALAWANKAHAHLAVSSVVSGAAIRDASESALAAIDKALALDPNISEAYSALCDVRSLYEYDFAAAERECKRALELDPNSAFAHKVYASFLSTRGRHDESFAELETAMRLDPASFFSDRLYANQLYWTRRYDEAIAHNKRILEINPNDFSRHNNLIRAYEMQGKEAEAFEWFIRSLMVRKRDAETLERYKLIYAAKGWRGVLAEREKEGELNNFRRAALNATLGNKDLAFHYLEKAFEERSWLIAFLQIEPQLDPLRDDRRYLDLLNRVESGG